MNYFDQKVIEATGSELVSDTVRTIQVNVGFRCNMSCRHCHVGGSPERTEVMDWSTMESVMHLARVFSACLVDITGGAPELNPDFKKFVTALKAQGNPVQVRTNLTVFFEEGQEDIPEFYRTNGVHLVASLPCYLESNVNAQRGTKAFEKSIEGMKRLNALGYGIEPELPLNLVYNPGGPSLPPGQEGLEKAYRQNLRESHGIEFSHLLTIANMPIGRFLEDLERQGKDQEYCNLLIHSFNPETLPQLMCRHQVSIAWDGVLADCDFNQVLGLSLAGAKNVNDVEPEKLEKRRIVTGEHCFGCTAGAGSSCGGALVA